MSHWNESIIIDDDDEVGSTQETSEFGQCPFRVGRIRELFVLREKCEIKKDVQLTSVFFADSFEEKSC